MITERAPAKINLYLHVTGKRADGFHLLDSLVVFAGAGEAADCVTLSPGGPYALDMTGPYGAGLRQEDPEKNLVTKALRFLGSACGRALDFRIGLEKNLPIASGIGGGSADAAAALRAAARYYGMEADHPALLDAARHIGSDGIACYRGMPLYMRGTGNDVMAAPPLPPFFMLLVNPNIPLPTGPVYQAFAGPFTPEAPFEKPPVTAQDLAAMLAMRRNDLQKPATALCKAIADVIDVLAAEEGCLLARLSGSGATCFGLFARKEEAQRAADKINAQIREWWVAVA